MSQIQSNQKSGVYTYILAKQSVGKPSFIIHQEFNKQFDAGREQQWETLKHLPIGHAHKHFQLCLTVFQ